MKNIRKKGIGKAHCLEKCNCEINLLMSRSRRKNPIIGITTAETEKKNKLEANRRLRRLNRIKIHKGDFELFQLREISNVWMFDKDGKQYLKKPYWKDIMK